MRRSMRKKGFSMVEMMIVVGVIGLLASIAQVWYTSSQYRARRVESVLALESLQVAQFAYYADRSEFAANFEDLDFQLNGARGTGSVFQGKKYTHTLSRPWGTRSWYCSSTAELDGDAWPDVMIAYERL
jgi:prepilin-type N-terminal cleavage/methylation domain-containing protein